MSNLIRCLLVPLLVALAFGSVAFAGERAHTKWRTPGTAPFSSESIHEMSGATLTNALMRIGAPTWAIEKFVDRDYVCEWRDLENGERGPMMYRDMQVINAEVAFGPQVPKKDRKAERCRVTNDQTGEVFTVTDPSICHNLSVLETPEPPRNPCYNVNMDYRENPQLRTEIAGVVNASGKWGFSKAQLTLYPDAPFGFVLVHLDLTKDELRDMLADECFGYYDRTGFHREVDVSCRFCVAGTYPPPGLIREFRRETGIELPEKEPGATLLIPLADANGGLSLPLRYADRLGWYCILVTPYHVSVRGYERFTSIFGFDLVWPEQGQRSLDIGRKRRKPGEDIPLLEDNSYRVRRLQGEHGF